MSVDNFAILAFVDPIGIVTSPGGMGIFESKRAWGSQLDSRRIAYGMANPISKPAWRYTIGSTPEFWLISSSQNDPLLGPQFYPPRVVNRRPHVSMPTRSRDPISSCTLREKSQILPRIPWVIGLALAGRATRENDANFGDFGIMTPLDEPSVP